ncbi:MAG TPA: hypothetical protein DEH78_05595 [Solibacterales bacterium]|nr:hypothetical protein [Bryobacterales bacterium]
MNEHDLDRVLAELAAEEPPEEALAQVRVRVRSRVRAARVAWRWATAAAAACVAIAAAVLWTRPVPRSLAPPKAARAAIAPAPQPVLPDYRRPAAARPAKPPRRRVPVIEPLTVKLVTADPDVIVYWIVDGTKGDTE